MAATAASAHVDTFTRDHLPPRHQWPDLLLDQPDASAVLAGRDPLPEISVDPLARVGLSACGDGDGHDVAAFKEPAVMKMLIQGIKWAARRL